MRLLVMVLALSGLIMVGCSGPKQKPEDVALAFNEAVFAEDVQKIMSIMYTDEDYVAIHGNEEGKHH